MNQTERLLSALQQLESQIANIRTELGASVKMVTTEPKAIEPKATEPKATEPKAKREISAGVAAWNENVKNVLAQMKTDGWKHPVTGKEPIYRDALAEAGRLRGIADPAVAAKQAEQKLKKAELKAKKLASSSSSVVSVTESVASVEKKPRNKIWEGMTDEQKAERLARLKAGREAKKAQVTEQKAVAPSINPFDEPVSALSSDVESIGSKKRGPPKGVKLSEEERIKRKTKAQATRAAKKVAALPSLPNSPADSLSLTDDEEITERTFTTQIIGKNKVIYKNALGHCRAYTPNGPGEWLGIYDTVKQTIETSVPVQA